MIFKNPSINGKIGDFVIENCYFMQKLSIQRFFKKIAIFVAEKNGRNCQK
jgi:phage terminase large subunit-like protein